MEMEKLVLEEVKAEEGLKVDEIKLLIETSPTFAVRCLKELYKYQTEEEKSIECTKDYNEVGFNGVAACDKMGNEIFGYCELCGKRGGK